MVALCGEALMRYYNYFKTMAKNSLHTKRCMLHVVDILSDRCARWREISAKYPETKKDLVIHEGDIRAVSMAYKCRLQDVSVGAGLRETMSVAIPLLISQTKAKYCHTLWKAQIISAALRSCPQSEILSNLQWWVGCLGYTIESINGLLVERHGLDGMFGNRGKVRHSYLDRLLKRTCVVKEHTFKLKSLPYLYKAKDANLYVYTCMNGSHMLHAMVMYR